MTDSPNVLDPERPPGFRGISRKAVALVFILLFLVAGVIVWKISTQKPFKPKMPSAQEKSRDSIGQSRDKDPDYLNVPGIFPGKDKTPPAQAGNHRILPPGVPDLSRKTSLLSHPVTSSLIPSLPPPTSSGMTASTSSSVPGASSGLFVSSVDGGLDHASNPVPSRIPTNMGTPPAQVTLPPSLPGARGQKSSYEQTNMQDQKETFLKDSEKPSPDILNQQVQDPASPFEVQAGSVIHAELVTGINSDLPGTVTAQVTGNVYDSIEERFLMIPQGSKLVGKYDSKVAVGETRILMAWERIIFPDGRSIDLSGMPGVDLEGYAGFHDLVDNHYLKIFGNAILMSLVMSGAQLSQPYGGYGMSGASPGFYGPSMGQEVVGSVGSNMSMTMEQYLGNVMNIQPTLKIRPGYRFDVTVTKDMIFPGPYIEKGE